MKKWIGLLVFLFSMQAFSSSLYAAEYKVVEDSYRGPKSLESILNKYSSQGWKLHDFTFEKGRVIFILQR